MSIYVKYLHFYASSKILINSADVERWSHQSRACNHTITLNRARGSHSLSHFITFRKAEQTNKVNCSFLAVCFTSKSNSPMSTMLMFLFVGDLAWVHWLWGIYSKALKGESQRILILIDDISMFIMLMHNL